MSRPVQTSRQSWWPFAGVIAALGTAFLLIARGYTKRYPLPFAAATGIYVCFLLLLMYALAPALPASRDALGKLLARRARAVRVLVMLTVPYVCYAVGTLDFRWIALGRLIMIAAPPLILYSAFPLRDRAKFSWQDILVAVWFISGVLFHLFDGIWVVPTNLDFVGRLFMLSLGALCWVYIRPVPDLGYTLDTSARAIGAAAMNFVFFAAISIPVGFLLGFIAWNPRWQLPQFLASFIEILVFIAALEELFFRGFLQNLLSKSLGSWWRAQLIASCIFGLFHVLHRPFPNWRYVILASIAGWFYGSAYRTSGTLFASVVLHAMVDTLWRTLFTK